MAAMVACFASRHGATGVRGSAHCAHARAPVRPHRRPRRCRHRAEPVRAAGAARAAVGERDVRVAARPLGVVLGLSATFLLTIAFTATVLEHVGLGGSRCGGRGSSCSRSRAPPRSCPPSGRLLERPLAWLGAWRPTRLGEGFGSGLLVGAALGFVYAPCAGPILAAVVAASAATGQTVAIAARLHGGHRRRAVRHRARRPPRARARCAARARGACSRRSARCSS